MYLWWSTIIYLLARQKFMHNSHSQIRCASAPHPNHQLWDLHKHTCFISGGFTCQIQKPCISYHVTLYSSKGMDFVPLSSMAFSGIQTIHIITTAEVLRKCTKQLSLPHSILSHVFRNIMICKNNAICSFSQSKSYSATNVLQQFSILSAG